MQYQKVVVGETVIEFHNNWLGVETVICNGKIVSKESSIWGTNHYFTEMADGHLARYILTTKVNESMQVMLDLSRNGELIQKDIPVIFGTKPKKPINKPKKLGLVKLNAYDLDDALAFFKMALDIDPKDPEVFFHMACAYSVLEETKEGFEALKLAKAHGLSETESILTHDMLAFIRMHSSFEGFLQSGFTEYQLDLLDSNDE